MQKCGPTSRRTGGGDYNIFDQGSILDMKFLKKNHCPNCGIELVKVRAALRNTACGMFHAYPGIANLVVGVVNNERSDIRATLSEGQVITKTIGEDVHPCVEDAVIAVLDDMNEIVFPD